MFIKKFVLRAAGGSLAAIVLMTAPRLGAQTPSESERLQKLERAVEQLQHRNAELEQEVAGLKKQAAVAPEGRMKTKVSYDGKTYVGKAVAEEEQPPVFVVPRGSELELVLGGYIQINFEDGDVSAFEGSFGLRALKDRFRLRRTRVNLTGDFAEQFDFKVEGDFGQGDGLNSNRLAFSATDIFVNWHQFPEAQVNVGVNDNNNFMYVGRLELMPFKGKIFGQESSLKLGGDVLNSRDDAGTNISSTLNLLVNADGSLSPFVLPGADERTAWGVDAWFKLGPFDLIGEYLEEYVDGRTVNGVAPGFANFTTNGYYVQGSYFLIPKKLQVAVRWEDLNPGQKGDDGIHSITGGLNYYIHGDDIKLMANYIHTWSDFRQAHPQLGDDQFDEVIMRLQLMF